MAVQHAASLSAECQQQLIATRTRHLDRIIDVSNPHGWLCIGGLPRTAVQQPATLAGTRPTPDQKLTCRPEPLSRSPQCKRVIGPLSGADQPIDSTLITSLTVVVRDRIRIGVGLLEQFGRALVQTTVFGWGSRRCRAPPAREHG